MIDNLQQFVTTYSRLFPAEPVPPMPQKPQDLSMTVTMAMRDANPFLWQSMFGGRGAPLPADVQQRSLTGQVNPEDEGALRAAHMDAYAAEADRQREAVIERSRQAIRAREKAIFEQQAQKSAEFRSMGLLGRLAASPVSERAAAQARAQWGITE